jgi:hypothetical protein
MDKALREEQQILLCTGPEKDARDMAKAAEQVHNRKSFWL